LQDRTLVVLVSSVPVYPGLNQKMSGPLSAVAVDEWVQGLAVPRIRLVLVSSTPVEETRAPIAAATLSYA